MQFQHDVPREGAGSRSLSLSSSRSSPAPETPPPADRRRATPGPPSQTFELGACLRELGAGPDQRGVVGRRDRLRALDDRDVLAHRQHGNTASNSA